MCFACFEIWLLADQATINESMDIIYNSGRQKTKELIREKQR